LVVTKSDEASETKCGGIEEAVEKRSGERIKIKPNEADQPRTDEKQAFQLRVETFPFLLWPG